MIPSPWVGVILALGVYRIVRILGWDDMPWLVQARNYLMGRNEGNRGEKLWPVTDPRGSYTHPAFAKFITCPFCQGFWVSCIVYVVWIYAPTAVLYVTVPLALSATVGLVSRNLDP